MHPEVSFRAMAAETLPWSKKSWNGQLLRCHLLEKHGIVIPANLHEVGAAGPDDVLDAAAAAWTAWRRAKGCAKYLPEQPTDEGEGRIWY